MIKYFCDRCGAEMTKEKRHGFVSVNIHGNRLASSNLENSPFQASKRRAFSSFLKIPFFHNCVPSI